MGSENTKRKIIAGVLAIVVVAFQVISLTRYMSRLPDDTLGVLLHVVIIVLWSVIAILFFRKSQ